MTLTPHDRELLRAAKIADDFAPSPDVPAEVFDAFAATIQQRDAALRSVVFWRGMAFCAIAMLVGVFSMAWWCMR